MGEGCAIRPGVASDIPDLLALWRAAGSAPSVTDNAEGLGRLLRHDPGALLVAELDGAIVGSLIAAWDGWRGGLYRLAVDPQNRRAGIATELVRAGERRLVGLGATRLSAIVIGGDSEIAPAVWRALGYDRQTEAGRFVREV
jgi:ribosomal protein S18 acetylase RimI-like enzyme